MPTVTSVVSLNVHDVTDDQNQNPDVIVSVRSELREAEFLYWSSGDGEIGFGSAEGNGPTPLRRRLSVRAKSDILDLLEGLLRYVVDGEAPPS